eukprot:1376193-Prorocentrum_lima.AAC.1
MRHFKNYGNICNSLTGSGGIPRFAHLIRCTWQPLERMLRRSAHVTSKALLPFLSSSLSAGLAGCWAWPCGCWLGWVVGWGLVASPRRRRSRRPDGLT